MKIEELKEKARNHEQREEWHSALDLYGAALRHQDQEEAPDISLYNRVGDIQTRLGQPNSAVEHYVKAIDLYLEAELPNNAIAICKKVLRNFPERNVFFRRMGQIRAGQGFLPDAKQNFLTYAERVTAMGDIESALNSLVEFVQLSPDDVEIRQGLASQLEFHDRVEAAVEQYTQIYRLLLLGDREPEAEAIALKLGELAPDLLLPDLDALQAEASAHESEDFVLESTSLDGFDSSGWVEDQEAIPEVGHLEIPDFVDAAHEAEAEMAGVSEAIDWGDEEGVGSLADLQLDVVPEEDEEVEGDLESLPFLDVEGEEEEEVEVEEEAEGELEPLPFLDVEGEEEEEVEVEEVEEEEETDLEALPTLEVKDGEQEEVGPAISSDQVGLAIYEQAAEGGDLDLALDMVREVIQSDTDNLELHQRLVEYAFRKSDDAALTQAYMGLAGCLARTGAPVKASAVYRQVLALAPAHEGALQGIRELEGASRPLPPLEVASSQEYVDLGALVLGDEGEKTTRWTVTADAPSGDDQADFAKMLSQFKEKVSEHLAVDDVAAHHDLGTAYMEMGLLDEAIAEFQMALRASPGHLPTHEVMGRCWLEMDKPDMAIRALNRALGFPFEVEDELIGIYYLMGQAKEKIGKTAEALEFYDKVFSLDINFEDVTERLRALR